MRAERANSGSSCCCRRCVLWLGLLIVIPHVDMFLVSLRERVGAGEYETSLANYMTFVERAAVLMTFVRTAVMSILATLITLLIAFPVAYYIAKIAKGRLQSALFLLCLMPFWVSELVRTFGWMILLREIGRDLDPAAMDAASPTSRSRCSTTTRRSWSAWSTPRCCSWWCRWSPRSRAWTTA